MSDRERAYAREKMQGVEAENSLGERRETHNGGFHRFVDSTLVLHQRSNSDDKNDGDDKKQKERNQST